MTTEFNHDADTSMRREKMGAGTTNNYESTIMIVSRSPSPVGDAPMPWSSCQHVARKKTNRCENPE